MPATRIGVYSGCFDPLHHEHILRIDRAKLLCDQLVVIVEHDEYIQTKRPVFMGQLQRAAIVASLKSVDTVMCTSPKTSTADLIRALSPDVYFIGSDHKPEDIPEYRACEECSTYIKVLYEHQLIHSSDLLNDYAKKVLGLAKGYNNPPVAVSVLVESQYATILLGRRPTGEWDLPGGFLEAGESLMSCARRELTEETGLVYDAPLKYVTSKSSVYSDGRKICCVYFAAKLAGNPRITDELVEYQWVHLPESIPANMFNKADACALSEYLRGVHR